MSTGDEGAGNVVTTPGGGPKRQNQEFPVQDNPYFNGLRSPDYPWEPDAIPDPWAPGNSYHTDPGGALVDVPPVGLLHEGTSSPYPAN